MCVHLGYKPPSSWRILFWSGGRPRKFSSLKKFRSLVVPSGGCRKEIIIQGIMTPTGVLPNGQSCLRRKRDITGESVHSPRQYVRTDVRTVYIRYQSIRTTSLANPPIRTTPLGTLFTATLQTPYVLLKYDFFLVQVVAS